MIFPMPPMNDNFERAVENLAEGLPEADAPAERGGFGADSPELGEAGEALRQEGVLDENAEQNTEKKK
jgi:hypothetical protein